jgi:hypothetical protein
MATTGDARSIARTAWVWPARSITTPSIYMKKTMYCEEIHARPLAPRLLGPELERASRAFPALIVTGPRRAGKTTLLRRLFPSASYHLLEDPDRIARVRRLVGARSRRAGDRPRPAPRADVTRPLSAG